MYPKEKAKLNLEETSQPTIAFTEGSGLILTSIRVASPTQLAVTTKKTTAKERAKFLTLSASFRPLG